MSTRSFFHPIHQTLVTGLVLALPLLAETAVNSPKPQIVQSRITEVTVYTDRAQVTRSATLRLTQGAHTLRFDKLPESIEQSSVQVSGQGSAILRDVSFQQEHFTRSPDQDRRKLFDRKTALEDSLRSCDDIIKQSQAERTFLENIARTITTTPEKEAAAPEMEPDKWIKMVAFYRTKLAALDLEIRTVNHTIRQVRDEIEKVDREIGDIDGQEQRTQNVVDVTVDKQGDGELTLQLSCIVYGPSWTPLYDLRVSSDAKKMQVSYHAVVRQNTSEDWDGVHLRLSTAQAMVSGVQPELTPWYVDVERGYFLEKAEAQSGIAMRKSAAPQMMNLMDAAGARAEVEAGLPPPMAAVTSIVETKATSVVYAIDGRTVINADNTDHHVTVATTDFPLIFRYSTAPKLSPYAYLKAKATNTSEYVFLPGKTNVFLDNHFVCSARLEQVAPAQEFWTFLGIDEGIRVERKIIKRFEREDGVIGKKTKINYEFQIKIANNKKIESEVVVWDQVPISNNEQITVALTEPQINKENAAVKINEFKYLEWYFKLKPGQEVAIPFKYSIEYPAGLSVRGLE
jgi:uncharacterized protein (TIGR02231 family)